MGVDVNYLYGYGIDLENIEWDIDYLKEKYKDKANEKIDKRFDFSNTYYDFISELEESIENEEDVYELADLLNDMDNLYEIKYTNNALYLIYNHKHISQIYPNGRLCELDDLSKLYAKELGVKNLEDIKWIEFGYFD